MSGGLVAGAEEACHFIEFLLGWSGEGELPVFIDRRPGPQMRVPLGAGELWRRSQRIERMRDGEIAVGLPVGPRGISGSTVLWAWVSGRDSVRRAARFQPAPSLVLRMGSGSERLLLWGLREVVPWVSVGPANERISYALHAARTRCLPEKLRVPLPGTFLRLGRARAAPVLTTRLELGEDENGRLGHARTQVVARLKDPPPRDAWRHRGR